MIKPKLSRFDLTMIVVSLVIGVGIFQTPAAVAKSAGQPEIFFAAWIFGGVIAICGALTFAEIGSRMPVAGGFYKLFSYSYHPAYAFMLNWAGIIINAASATAVGIVGAQYLRPIIFSADAQTETNMRIIVIAITLLLYVLNFIGIKSGARTQNVLSGIKIVMILVFCCGVFLPGSHPDFIPSYWSCDGQIKNPQGFDMVKAFGVCLISVFFTYGGYQNTVNFGADIKDAKKNLARSIFWGIGIVIILYLLFSYTCYHLLNFDFLQCVDLPAGAVAKRMFGDVGLKIVSLTIFISVLGFINTSLLSNPRIYYAMAEEKTLPAIFGKVNSKTQAQEFALSFFVALMLISLFVFNTFGEIVNYVMFIDTIAMASAGASIFIFRWKEKKEKTYTGFKVKFYPWIPLLFLLTLLFVNINVVFTDPKNSLIGFCIFILGFPIYLGMKKINSSK